MGGRGMVVEVVEWKEICFFQSERGGRSGAILGRCMWVWVYAGWIVVGIWYLGIWS